MKHLNGIIKTSKSATETAICLGFTTFINRKPLKFTCGLFDFNVSLVLKITGALVTNLIILIQFDMTGNGPALE